MTKPITKARLLQTLENISAWHQRTNGHNCDVVRVLARFGMQTAFDQAVGRHEPLNQVRADLELTVLEVRKDEAALEALMDKWDHNINRKRAKEDRVFKIQEAAGVSGIEWEFFELPDGYTIDYPWFSEDYLPWIEADLHILRWHREQVLAFFLDYLDRSQKQLWRLELGEKRDQWVKCPNRFLLSRSGLKNSAM
ncbi:hypothetical protein Lepto7375DRAFT_0560 [Leptolyngbya sp. PCC 7375]|nr:hypothetical protein Lepto7375DRAFT_0560 [Leptolyngbya sp. PCC 7375]